MAVRGAAAVGCGETGQGGTNQVTVLGMLFPVWVVLYPMTGAGGRGGGQQLGGGAGQQPGAVTRLSTHNLVWLVVSFVKLLMFDADRPAELRGAGGQREGGRRCGLSSLPGRRGKRRGEKMNSIKILLIQYFNQDEYTEYCDGCFDKFPWSHDMLPCEGVVTSGLAALLPYRIFAAATRPRNMIISRLVRLHLSSNQQALVYIGAQQLRQLCLSTR